MSSGGAGRGAVLRGPPASGRTCADTRCQDWLRNQHGISSGSSAPRRAGLSLRDRLRTLSAALTARGAHPAPASTPRSWVLSPRQASRY